MSRSHDDQLSGSSEAVYKISHNRIISSILKHAIQMLKATNGFYLMPISLLIILSSVLARLFLHAANIFRHLNLIILIPSVL